MIKWRWQPYMLILLFLSNLTDSIVKSCLSISFSVSSGMTMFTPVIVFFLFIGQQISLLANEFPLFRTYRDSDVQISRIALIFNLLNITIGTVDKQDCKRAVFLLFRCLTAFLPYKGLSASAAYSYLLQLLRYSLPSFRGLRPQLLDRTHKEPSQKFLSRLWSVKASKPFRVSHPQCYRMVLGGRATMQTALLLPSEMFNSMPQSRGRVRSTPQVPMWFIRNKQLSNQSGSRISKEQSSLLLCKPHL